MRSFLSGVALLALVACETAVPDSGAGVGFGDYNDYLRQSAAQRDAQLSGVAPAPNAVSTETPATDGAVSGPQPALGAGEPATAEELAAEARAAIAAANANSGVPPVEASPSNPPPVQVEPNDGSLSDENDFEAVGARRSIETDAARIQQNRAQYQVIEPTAVPKRTGTAGPNLVEYALSTKHPRGSQVYRRINLAAKSRYERNCAKYPSSDLAQVAFLERGGPQRDRMGLDPDGDGYACAWDPAPFRSALGN